MPWPLSQDYNEAVQSPATSLADPELRSGQPTTNALGMPQPRSGNFADVYEFACPGGRWAVKCFTREVAGLRDRYGEISRHLASADLPFAVEFHYLEQGVRIRGAWYPALKMRWVEGQLLNEFVRDNLGKPARLQALSQIWGRMAKRLREAGLAHADLQHGNVILVPGSTGNSLAVKLIDYDGMFVPALAGRGSAEVGHANYQHPQRLREGSYGPEVDRFPLLVVAAALRALTVGGQELWDRYDNGDNLLFKESDLRAPTKSPLFAELLRSGDAETHSLVMQLIQAIRLPLDACPLLGEALPEKAPAPTLPTPAAMVVGPRLVAPIPFAPPAAFVRVAASVPPTGLVQPAFTIKPTAEPPPRPDRTKKQSRSPIPLIASGVVVMAVALGLIVGAMPTAKEKPSSPFVKGDDKRKKDRPGPDVATKDGSKDKQESSPVPVLGPDPKAREDPSIDSNLDQWAAREITNSIGMKLARIPKGKFVMGSPKDEENRNEDEGPEHEVEIPSPFHLGVYEVTQGEYEAVMGRNPSSFSATGNGKVKGLKTGLFPVENVSYEDAVSFCEKLSARIGEKEKKRLYRLPTEAEWEYACRGGADMKTPFHFGKALSSDHANFDGNHPYGGAAKSTNLGRTCQVGSFEPNGYGLYDMHGNVWEWCSDWYGAKNYSDSPAANPPGPAGGSNRVIRGGSWGVNGRGCRSAVRNSFTPTNRYYNIGFRVVLVPSRPTVEELARLLVQSKDSAIRRNCAIALGKLGESAKSAVPALAQALEPVADAPVDPIRNRPYEEVREQAASALVGIKFPANELAIPAMRRVIRKDSNPLVRQRCISALFTLRDLERYDMTKPLTDAIEETDDTGKLVRYDAARLLASVLRDKAPDKTCDVLLDMLANRNLKVEKLGGDARYMAAEALGRMGDKSKNNPAIVAALRKALKDGDARLEKAARATLEILGLSKETPESGTRKQWTHSRGKFEQVEGKDWRELGPDGRVIFRFREVTRTDGYVELARNNGAANRIWVRLHPGKCLLKINAGAWSMHFTGEWK